MDIAGNPYGSYEQEEGCIHCGAGLQPPTEKYLLKRIFTTIALGALKAQKPFVRPHRSWIHVLFEKRTVREDAASESKNGAVHY
jgi:hypothetical protein